MPYNFRYIGLLLAAFPDCKIVHVSRDVAAVCWSIFKQYFLSTELGYCYALPDIVDYYALYLDLMRFWQAKFRNPFYNLDYELLTVNQETETKKLIQYIGLEWEEMLLVPESNRRSVATASDIQVRQKVYRDSSRGWILYKPWLNGILDNLND